jgi:glutathione peroxidase-family protein
MLVSCATACSAVQVAPSGVDMPIDFYDIVEKTIDGEMISFDIFRGKVVYVVNVASECGYTESNYNLLQRLTGLRSKGLELVSTSEILV